MQTIAKSVVTDSFIVPGNEAGTRDALRRLAHALESVADHLPSDTTGLDLTSLKIEREHDLVLIRIEATPW